MAYLTIQIPVELDSVYFVTCPKQGLEMEVVVLHRVAFLEYFCPKQGQDFKPLAAHLYPNMGQVPPPLGHFGPCEVRIQDFLRTCAPLGNGVTD